MSKQRTKRQSKPDKASEELDRLAHSITFENTRPPSHQAKLLRQVGQRAKGRPRKSSDERSVPVQITLQPKLLRDVDELADRTGKSRSQLIADGLKYVLQKQRRKAS